MQIHFVSNIATVFPSVLFMYLPPSPNYLPPERFLIKTCVKSAWYLKMGHGSTEVPCDVKVSDGVTVTDHMVVANALMQLQLGFEGFFLPSSFLPPLLPPEPPQILSHLSAATRGHVHRCNYLFWCVLYAQTHVYVLMHTHTGAPWLAPAAPPMAWLLSRPNWPHCLLCYHRAHCAGAGTLNCVLARRQPVIAQQGWSLLACGCPVRH
jgi:hypothetical protein